MHFELIGPVLALLALANGAPVVAKDLFAGAAAWPIDFGRTFVDGRPVLGSSKTIRGVVVAVAVSACAAPLMGLSWRLGAAVAAASMAGDLVSSFIKRRLGLAPSSMALGLDQIPEALFGAMAASMALPLSPGDIAVSVLAFFVGQVIASRVSHALGLRAEPY